MLADVIKIRRHPSGPPSRTRFNQRHEVFARQLDDEPRVIPASAPVLSPGVNRAVLTQKMFAIVAETISPRSLSITASSNRVRALLP